MTKQIEFARETRRLEKQADQIEKGFLAFVSEQLQDAADLSTAEKYTILTAFVEEFTTGGGSVYYRIIEMSGVDETASKLAAVMHQYDLAYGFEEKRDEVRAQMAQNDTAFEKWYKENTPASPLFPNK